MATALSTEPTGTRLSSLVTFLAALGLILALPYPLGAKDFQVLYDLRVDGNTVSPYGGIGRYENLLKYSEDLTQAANWTRAGLDATTPVALNAVGPDGVTNSAVTMKNGAATGGTLAQTVTGASASTAYTFSVWAKAGTSTTANLEMTGNGTTPGSATTSATLTSSWQRFSVTYTTVADATSVTVTLKNTGAAAATILLWGAQLEKASSTGVYVKTAADTVATARGLAADSAHIFGNLEVHGSVTQHGGTSGQTLTGTLTFNNVATDITTGTNEHLALMPNGTGNVGIGTATPNDRLHVAGATTADATRALVTIGTNAIAGGHATIGTGGTWVGINAPATGAGSTADFLNFQANGTLRMSFSNAGRLGINVSPATTLEVSDAGTAGADVEVARFNLTNATTHPYLTIGSLAGGGFFLYNKETSRARIGLHGANSYAFEYGTTGSLVHAAGGSIAPISAFGVLPGNASTKGLVVRGAASQTANLLEWQDSSGLSIGGVSPSGNANLGFTTSAATNALQFVKGLTVNADQASKRAGIALHTGGAGVAYLGYSSVTLDGAGKDMVIIGTDNTTNDIGFFTDLGATDGADNLTIAAKTPVMLIKGTGNVGIGTAVPNAKLDVLGTARLGDSTTNYAAVSGTGVITYAGSAQPKRTIVLTAAGAIVPASNAPQQLQTNGTNVSFYTLNYSGTAAGAESAYWEFLVPDSYTGTTVNATLYWLTPSVTTTNVVKWFVDMSGLGDAQTLDAALQTAGTVTDSPSAAADQVLVTSEIASITTGWAVGEYAVVRVQRNAADAADTETALAKLLMVKLEWTAAAESD